MGAHKFYERGEADEATSLELVIEPWLEGVYSAIDEQVGKIKNMNQTEVDILLKPIEINEEENEQDGDKFMAEDKVRIPIMAYGKLIDGRIIECSQGKEIIELKLKFDKGITKDQIDVGSSFSLYPQNSQKDIDYIIEQFKWKKNALIGNKTVEQMLRYDIDILSERIKLSKFLSEYDLKFLPQDVINHPHLTFKEFAKYAKYFDEIPYDIVEDDIPKIKSRHYSIINDPYYDEET